MVSDLPRGKCRGDRACRSRRCVPDSLVQPIHHSQHLETGNLARRLLPQAVQHPDHFLLAGLAWTNVVLQAFAEIAELAVDAAQQPPEIVALLLEAGGGFR